MPSYKSAGKSREDLALVAQLAGLVGAEESASLSRAELVKIIEKENRKIVLAESGKTGKAGRPAKRAKPPEPEEPVKQVRRPRVAESKTKSWADQQKGGYSFRAGTA
jgi:hypothetical protein